MNVRKRRSYRKLPINNPEAVASGLFMADQNSIHRFIDDSEAK